MAAFRKNRVAGKGWTRWNAWQILLTLPSIALLLSTGARAEAPADPGCDYRVADPVDLVGQDRDRFFQDGMGRRYFAAGVHPSTAAKTDWRADGRLEAVPLGNPNRWGLIPAWIVQHKDGDPVLLQALLLRRGEALFAPDALSAACADHLRSAEDAARRSETGLWNGETGTKILSSASPEAFDGLAGRYVIARGRIVSLGKTRSTRYLNFGRHWKTDFTVTLKSSDEDAFNEAFGVSGWQIEDLAGRFVEVRGLLQDRDGPLIALRHPDQLVIHERRRATRVGRNSN